MLRILVSSLCGVATIQATPDLAEIGRSVFTDKNLSNPPGQSCMTCHKPNHAFADPRRIFPGAVLSFSGNRNAPSFMYAADFQNWNILDSEIKGTGLGQSRALPGPKGYVRVAEE
jgi:cytochrome c peroxidase